LKLKVNQLYFKSKSNVFNLSITKLLVEVLDQIPKDEQQGKHEICENVRKIVNKRKNISNEHESKVDMHPYSNNNRKQFLSHEFTFNFQLCIIKIK
jgi:hypothetical protein